jgi:hypothetical protein
MIHVKGLTIRSRLEYARTAGGERLIQQLREAPAPVGEVVTAPMISVRQFPLSTDDSLCHAIASRLGGDEDENFMKMGAYYADTNRGMQNIVLGVKTDPLALIARIPYELMHYLSGETGAASHEFPAPNSARIIRKGHRECYRSHCVTGVGYFRRVLENAGIEGVRGSSSECVGAGAARCVWEFSWGRVTGLRRDTQALKAIVLPQ